MRIYLLFIVIFICIISSSKLYGQIILDPPCAGTVNNLGQTPIFYATYTIDGIEDTLLENSNIGYVYETCLTSSNYDFEQCNESDISCGYSPSASNCILNIYPGGNLVCFDCTAQNCVPATDTAQIVISDTIILANKHIIRFFQQNWFQGPLIYQGMIDLEQRCVNKDFGIKCNVAVDGASSTIIDVLGPNPSSIGIRPATAPLDSIVNGYLNKYYVQPTVEAYQYFSPNGQNSPSDTIVNFEVFDINCPDWVLATFKVRKYQVPVLMVHGLASNGESWNDFASFLIQSGYDPSMISKPSIPNDQSFSSTYPTLNPYIQSLLTQYRSQGININRVNYIGHSMGGLLGRYHLQSTEYDNMQNINKLITVNTPHLGSEWANIGLDPRYRPLFSWINNRSLQIDLDGGAVDDLRVNSSAIAYMNSPQQLFNSKKAPIHSITSDWTGCTTFEYGLTWGFSISICYRFVHQCWDICARDCLLGEQNDGVVGLLSQEGGLSGLSSQSFEGSEFKRAHTEILKPNNEDVYSHLLNILNTPTQSDYFTRDGFTYQPLPPPLLQQDPEVAETRSAVDVEIANIENGDTIVASLNPIIEISGSTEVEGTIILYLYDNGTFAYDSSFQSSNNYIIPIPNGYTGRIDIGVLGTDGVGNTDFDSTYVYVSQTALSVNWNQYHSLKLMPNPTDDKIQLIGDIDWKRAVDIRIYDSLGRCVGNPILQNDLSISMKGYTAGIYLLSFSLDNTMYSFRILKE